MASGDSALDLSVTHVALDLRNKRNWDSINGSTTGDSNAASREDVFEDVQMSERMCGEPATNILHQAAMSNDAVAAMNSAAAELLRGWTESDKVIHTVNDMSIDSPDERFESAMERLSDQVGGGDQVDAFWRRQPFRIIYPHERGLRVDAGYLAWAYDTFYHAWWDLIPFEVSMPISVFGLAKMAVEWKAATSSGLSDSSILDTGCYNYVGNTVWDEMTFCEWLNSGRSARDVGFRNVQDITQGSWFIPVSQVNDALEDLLSHWPINHHGSLQVMGNLHRWRCVYRRNTGQNLTEASPRTEYLSWPQFERAAIMTLGNFYMPLTEISMEFRKRQHQRKRGNVDRMG
ncbi:hypothetical protein GNI_036360 [Gregarina niphandrodes]|uniref:Uncharacterized protein n=1 Tax=Gregarina niphandrodes TaxID=110365 RepID=A0A023BAM3_GRENI|nr:hypothetical protein GNI_036360 [Gregarina niphandrodes]EZG78435.1 hypothetical protein GNI_036360 [Gregarina niphandrodes]|eukprot:XP_011129309.1 hypothetical protein GNI_036360 [Gregarina niphandrodes]